MQSWIGALILSLLISAQIVSGVTVSKNVRAPATRVTLTQPSIDANAAQRRLQSLRSLYLLPATYFVKGSFQPLFAPSNVDVPVTIQVDQPRGGFVRVSLQGPVNTYQYDIGYNNADGWVNNVQVVGQTQNTGSYEQVIIEGRLHEIISRVQQLAFEKDGRLQFITDNGSTRVSFDESQAAGIQVHHIVPETYYVRGSFQPLGQMTYPVWLESQRPQGGLIKVVIRGANLYQYQISYNNADGWVNKVDFIDQTYVAEPLEQVVIEKKLLDIVSRTQQIAFEKDGRIQFITDGGSTRVSFDPVRLYGAPARRLQAAEKKTLKIVPETYMVNGIFQKLFPNDQFLVTAATTMDNQNDLFVELAVGPNTVIYSIKRKGDGWVTQIQKISETHNAASADQQQVQKSLTDLIDRVQQVAVEPNGRLQFITDSAATRVSFDPFTVTGRRLQAIEYRTIVPATYMVKSQFQKLFTGPEFPITVATEHSGVGMIKVLVRGINMYNYIISYNNADGWVNSVQFIDQTYQQASPDQMIAERNVIDIVSRTQQLGFEKDGRLQFITDNGATRVSFDLAAGRPMETLTSPTVSLSPSDMIQPFLQGGMPSGTYHAGEAHTLKLVPQTYMVNGQLQTLFTGPQFLITMRTNVIGDEMTVELNCGNLAVFLFGRQARDGWVTSRKLVAETHSRPMTPDQMAVQQKLMAVIGQAEQIAVETDGRTQFISGGGKTRVSFDQFLLTSSGFYGSNIPLRSLAAQEGVKAAFLEVVPESYTVKGTAQKLFESGPSANVSIQTLQDGSQIYVTLISGNVATHFYERQPTGIKVLRKQQIVELTNLAKPEQLAAFSKIQNILLRAEEVSIDATGKVAISADDGKTSISFKPLK